MISFTIVQGSTPPDFMLAHQKSVVDLKADSTIYPYIGHQRREWPLHILLSFSIVYSVFKDTTLAHAIKNGYIDFVRLLIKSGGKVRQKHKLYF